MKVVVYQPYVKERGGMEKVILEYAKRSEHDVEVLTLAYGPDSTFDGFENIEVKKVGDFDSPDSFVEQALNFGIKAAFRKIDLEEYDVLLVSEAGFGSPITIRNREIPTIAYVHTPLRATLPEFKDTYREGFPSILRPFYPLMTFSYSLLERVGWRNFDKVIANSQLTRERIVSKGLKREEEIEIINPGVDTEVKGSESYDNYFFYPSRFEPYKRQHLAIEAFEEAGLEDFELVLAGSSADPEYLEEMKEKAGENVRIETDVSGDRWRKLYANCYSVLFLAEKEDWGIVPLEAGSYEKPVIAVNEGGSAETVEDGETGFLVEADTDQIAEKMSYLAENPEEVEEMGKKGRKQIQKYSWDSFADKLDEKVNDLD